MPTYDYICLSCGELHEIFHSMTENSRKFCSSCKEGTLEKQIGTGTGIIFKGTGFYETDYKRKSPSLEEKSQNTECSHNTACKCSN